MTSALLIASMLMGVVGVPHCLVMCSVPCSIAAQSCGNSPHSSREVAGALQVGRLFGYALLGGVAASAVSFAHLLAGHVSALRPLWVMAQGAILVAGLVLLATGHVPSWLQSVHLPLEKLSARLHAGRSRQLPSPLRAFLLGMCWAILPCAQLYAAVALASLAGHAWGGALMMIAYALPGVLALWLGSRWFFHLFGANRTQPVQAQSDWAPVRLTRGRSAAIRSLGQLADSTWAVRITGAVLAASAVLMLLHSTSKMVQAICG
ncbi:sulfite exporter TauE/SafE family protein [Aquabacterium sp.]|uniref:sulfite exporter TauE/SafE family protein n=1 Tax=Aquabacterium sp. TaxID=1872578 RepID=UPI0035B37FD1